jgi:hypothetical protein
MKVRVAARAGLACALLAAAVARGDEPAEVRARAKEFFERGNAAYREGRYADAVVSYRESHKLVPAAAVLYNVAYCEELLGAREAAWLDYRRFLDVAGGHHPKRAEAEAKLAELVTHIQVPVAVSSNPAGAALFVDGGEVIVGRTPATLHLAPGQHKLRLTAERARPREVEVEARVGQSPVLDVVLDRYADVELDADPDDATLRREDQPGARWTGRYVGELAPGSYAFHVERAGYLAGAIAVVVRGGETLRQRVALARDPGRTGTLVVRSAVDGAAVSLDARPIGATPEARTDAAEGPHELLLERAGYVSYHGRVQVAGGATTTVEVRLPSERPLAASRAALGLWLVGAGAVVAGSVVGALALRDQAAWEQVPEHSLGDRARTRALAADVLLGSGAAALVGATLVWALTGHGSSTLQLVGGARR